MHDLKKYKDDFILLLEAGFIAVNQMDQNSAIKLFKAAGALSPESTLPKIGQGYLHLHKLELKEACEFFEHALKKEPQNEMAKTFLGLCLTMMPQGVTKGEQILEQMVHSSDNLVKNLSHSALDFVDTFVKKAPSPVQMAAEKPKKKRKTK